MTRCHAVIRADASPAIGAGHIVRCSALAEALLALGWRCSIAVRPPTLTVFPALAASGAEIHELKENGNEPEALAQQFGRAVDWLVIDSYRIDAGYQRACRSWARRLLVIDDTPGRPHDCELLLNQNAGIDADDYQGLLPAGARLLLGPEYALLRSQFRAARETIPAARRTRRGIRRVIISFGMTDPGGLATTAVAGIAASSLDADIDVVLGSAAPPGFDAAVAALPRPVTVHRQVEDMASLAAGADLAIGAAGSSAWERCCLGLPAVAVVAADNQAGIAAALETAGAAVIFSDPERFTPAALARVLEDLAGAPGRLSAMAANAARIVDGNGARRVVACMQQ